MQTTIQSHECLACVCVLRHFSRVWLCETLWTVARQAPLPWDSPGKNSRVGCHSHLQGNLPSPAIQPLSLMSPALAGRFFTTSTTWECLADFFKSCIFVLAAPMALDAFLLSSWWANNSSFESHIFFSPQTPLPQSLCGRSWRLSQNPCQWWRWF